MCNGRLYIGHHSPLNNNTYYHSSSSLDIVEGVLDTEFMDPNSNRQLFVRQELVSLQKRETEKSMELVNLEETVGELRKSFRSRRTRSASWRRAQLKGLKKMLLEKEEEILMALKEDLGKHRAEAYRDELGILTKSLNFALDHLDEWMAPKKAHVPIIAFPTSAETLREPLGVVLIFSSWNFPFGLTLDPLIGAIAAGNAALVKPSELAPASSSFIAKHIPTYLDNEAVKVIEGGASIAERLLEMKWDKIFFTGSARIARVIMSAAAKHLTPVALELGGKCPVILDHFSSSYAMKVAIKRIVIGKWGTCNGQTCIGIDYLLVQEKLAANVIDFLKVQIKNFFGNNLQETNSLSRVVNKNHFMRLKNLIEDPAIKASIVCGGGMDEDRLFIEPTILLDPPLGSQIMTEEIFGPLLPIITLERIEDSIEFLSSRPQPLAIYAFTKDETLKRRLISETSSGSVTFNDAIIQFACDTLPFGGVGPSGFGKYHGKFSFDEFSHEKAVIRRSFISEYSFRYPPWSDYKLALLRAAYNFNYIALFLLFVGLRRN